MHRHVPIQMPLQRWLDGTYTYAELNSLATLFAQYLATNFGIGVEKYVVLCFTNSTWPIVAMLAVLKASGACVSTNPDHPTSRIAEISVTWDRIFYFVMQLTKAASEKEQVFLNVRSVDATTVSRLQSSMFVTGSWDPPTVCHFNAAFVVYTSGSTGKPKGSILEHRCLTTSLMAIGQRSNMTTQTQTLQFSTYTFDAHILEIFGTLIHRGAFASYPTMNV